uniref:Uncharacterized protein n=1 Tax=Panagrolaimus davidi TaxID=227884 RepID=A0A914P8U0_9BILA
MDENCLFDKENKEKVKKIMGSQLTDEHFETIVKWFKCRIIIFNNGIWQRFGNWNSESEHYVPIFVLEKKNTGNKFVYEIVLTLKNDYQNLPEDVEEIHPIENEVRIDEHADINIPTMNTENSTDESPEEIVLLSDDIAAEGNPSDNNQHEDVEEIHPIENTTDENVTADPSHSTFRQANIIHSSNYRIMFEYYGGKLNQHLYIFNSADPTLCYNYSYEKTFNRFSCRDCRNSSKSKVSCYAKFITNENDEKCVRLFGPKHMCEPKKFKTVIRKPNFEKVTLQHGSQTVQHVHVFYSKDKTKYYDYAKNTSSYRCNGCNTLRINVTAKFAADENKEEIFVLNAEKHQCEPRRKQLSL